MSKVEEETWKEIERVKKSNDEMIQAMKNGELKDDGFDDFMKEIELYERNPEAWRKKYGFKIPHYSFEEK